jgi:hypothetical protein
MAGRKRVGEHCSLDVLLDKESGIDGLPISQLYPNGAGINELGYT